MRGKQAPKRQIKPDHKYNSVMVAKFINRVMQDGKKKIAQKIVYTAMDILAKESKMKPLESLDKAFDNVRPRVEVRSKRVGGSNYQVPMPVREDRQFAIATRWILDTARSNRGSSSFAESLGRELVLAFKGEGNAVRKKEETKRMADANRAFAQFA